MLKYFWNKLKIFFVSRSRISRVVIVFGLLVAVFGVFGLVNPAYAMLDEIAGVFAAIFLLIASLLGQILVLIIGVLLDVIAYNNFMDATAVTTGWVIVRDLCNLFFVLVLLVIGFGSILRLENFKYNQLLGKLVLMIILVNFSKMIAGFFIDISQVVLMTFANAFSATAAANFTDGLRLKEMLGFVNESGEASVFGGSLTALEKFGVALLPVALLLVAIFVMGAMVAVFMIRILMLWVLIVLSPLAYLFSVLPSSKQYADQWWKTFTKWVVTGPALAFFIWFGLTLIASGGTESIKLQTENQIVESSGGATNTLSATVSAVSSSDNLLQFAMAIGLFIIALVMAQSLGGMAGSIAGKALGKIQGMGAGALKMAGAPVRGAGELAKAGGRKIRREYRDSALGKYTNVGAMIAGAKKRGTEVEKLSKDMGDAQGKETWDKRPDWMGGGADVIPETQLVQARYERQMASEVSTLQKEQKAGLLEKVWNKGGKQNEMTRRAILQSLAAEGHIDDALGTDFFREHAEWEDVDENGKTVTKHGFTDEDGNYDSNIARSNFMRASISKGSKRGTTMKYMDPNALRTLYDIQQAGINQKHYEYAGEVVTDEKTGSLAFAEDVVKDETTGEKYGRMEIKNKIMRGELVKPTDRMRVGFHPHNMTVQALSKDGENMRLIPFNDPNHTAQLDEFKQKVAYAESTEKSFIEFSSARIGDLLGKLDAEDQTFEIHDDDRFTAQIQKLYEEFPQFVGAIEKKYNSKGYTYKGEKSENLHELADKLGWKKNSDYHKEETIKEEARTQSNARTQNDIDYEKNSADDKEEQARQLRQQAGQTNPEIQNLEAEYGQQKSEADRYEQEVGETRNKLSAIPTAGFEANSAENVAKREQLQSELNDKEAKASVAKAKASSTQSKLSTAYTKQKASDPEKIRQAEKLEADAAKHRARAQNLEVGDTIENFREDTNGGPVIAEMEAKIGSEDVKKIADAIESAIGAVTKSTKGVESGIFASQYSGITSSMNNLLIGLQKMQPRTKDKLNNHFGNILTGINAGQYTNRKQQLESLKMLGSLNKIFSRRSEGKGIDNEEKISTKVKTEDDSSE